MPQSNSRRDKMAREAGFPSYAAMKAWNDKYRKPQTNQTAAKPKRNFLQSLRDLHPINWAEKRVTSVLKKANRK